MLYVPQALLYTADEPNKKKHRERDKPKEEEEKRTIFNKEREKNLFFFAQVKENGIEKKMRKKIDG